MRKLIVLCLLIVLPVVGAVAGHWAGPFMARAHDTVQLSARVQTEEALGLTERTLESDAFRRTGRSTQDLSAAAKGVEKQFITGGTWLGAWCGLVLGVALVGLNQTRRREGYEVVAAECVECGRCFLNCPRERLRLRIKRTRPDIARESGDHQS